MKKNKNFHFKFNLLYLIFFIYVFQSPTKKYRIIRVCTELVVSAMLHSFF